MSGFTAICSSCHYGEMDIFDGINGSPDAVHFMSFDHYISIIEPADYDTSFPNYSLMGPILDDRIIDDRSIKESWQLALQRIRPDVRSTISEPWTPPNPFLVDPNDNDGFRLWWRTGLDWLRPMVPFHANGVSGYRPL